MSSKKALKNKNQNGPYTVVIKLGTSSIIHETTHQPLLGILSSIVETVVRLRNEGHRVILVSSGAVGVGLKRMNLPSRPKSLQGVQALAAIGQGRLIALWDNLFGQVEQPIAQVLLTRGDISDRTRYLNACNTFTELLHMGVVPIVNENDTVSVSEIRFGDNDSLSAITASMVHADYLFLLTDVDGLYTSNPRKDPDAKAIEVVNSVMEIQKQVSTATLGSNLGTGGMETKLIAAEIATAAGVATVITSSKTPSNIFTIIQYNSSIIRPRSAKTVSRPTSTVGIALTPSSVMSDSTPTPPQQQSTPPTTTNTLLRPAHTLFTPSQTPLKDVKSWTQYTLAPAGSVVIDKGAHQVLSRRESGGRLLAVGVVDIRGTFAAGQAVRIIVRRKINVSPIELGSTGKSRPTAASLGLRELVDSQAGTPRTPGTPDLMPIRGGQAGWGTASVSSMDPLSRGVSDGTVDSNVSEDSKASGDVDVTPHLGGKLTLEPDPHVPAPASQVSEEEWVEIEVGRGLANYNSVDIARVKGLKSTNMAQILGYADSEYVVENVTIRFAP